MIASGSVGCSNTKSPASKWCKRFMQYYSGAQPGVAGQDIFHGDDDGWGGGNLISSCMRVCM